ncbi:hypothetical protein [Methylobacterium thuringiense]|uniref:Uncharacterized protein n=1 Tax=Methylobacterium thuringiense TaxID=1003091 RepID=A0ABQ4TIN8_9HYPH|nr:hypothetical protein [Methylobacterium thuringiense]GJE55255.1 hypothetical protein EKPJFOCH_1744 [Methylobacterium thuringiense]
MSEPKYTLRLTERELWALKNGFDASFNGEIGNEVEIEAARKVSAAWYAAQADAKSRRKEPAAIA